MRLPASVFASSNPKYCQRSTTASLFKVNNVGNDKSKPNYILGFTLSGYNVIRFRKNVKWLTCSIQKCIFFPSCISPQVIGEANSAMESRVTVNANFSV